MVCSGWRANLPSGHCRGLHHAQPLQIRPGPRLQVNNIMLAFSSLFCSLRCSFDFFSLGILKKTTYLLIFEILFLHAGITFIIYGILLDQKKRINQIENISRPKQAPL